MKKINILLVILWMIVIFSFSSDIGSESSSKSDGLTKHIVDFISDITNIEASSVEDTITLIVRKGAHILEYLILGILVINVLKDYYDINYKYCLIGLLICYIYACSDEVHQLFVPGRSGKIIDTFVDLVGSSIGVFSYYLIRKKCKN